MDNLSSALQSVGDAFSGGAADAASSGAGAASETAAENLAGGIPDAASSAASDAGGVINAGSGINSILGGGAGGTGNIGADIGAGGGAAAPGPTAAAAPAGIAGGPGGSAAAIAAPSGTDVPFGSDQVPEQALNGKPTPPTSTMSGIMDFIKKNPGLALGGAAIGGNALLTPKIPNMGNLTAAGNNAAGVAGLASTLQTGQLPPGAQQMITNATNDAIAGIKSRYAAMGLSGSSMEAQDIQAAQERASAQTFQLADQITQQGLSAAGLEDQIFSNIANLQIQQDKGLQDAITGFASSAGLGAGLSASQGG